MWPHGQNSTRFLNYPPMSHPWVGLKEFRDSLTPMYSLPILKPGSGKHYSQGHASKKEPIPEYHRDPYTPSTSTFAASGYNPRCLKHPRRCLQYEAYFSPDRYSGSTKPSTLTKNRDRCVQDSRTRRGCVPDNKTANADTKVAVSKCRSTQMDKKHG